MPKKLLYVPVSREAMEELCRRAARERRRPQDEAALLLERALRQHAGEAARHDRPGLVHAGG